MKNKKLYTLTLAVTLVVSLSLITLPLLAASKKEIAQEKADIRKVSKEKLARLIIF